MTETPSIITQAKRQGFEAAFYDFRKAKVPGVDYYNSALVQKPDGLWLVARRSIAQEHLQYGQNDLMAFKLDENHLPQYGIKIHVPHSEHGEHFEDPRIIAHQGKYWLSACNFIIYSSGDWTGAHQVLLEIDDEWITHRRHDPEYGRNGSSTKRNHGNEKNWLWFVHDGALHMVYMTQPHIVTRWDELLILEREWITYEGHPGWQHGQPRGGSAPVRVGDEYFSFFHSSTDWRDGKRRYHMGCYAFEAKPPFKITRMTTKPLLSGSQRDPWAEGKPLVVFPCSSIYTEWMSGPPHRTDVIWTISLGVNDLVSAYVKIPHAKLLQKLDRGIETIAPPAPEKPRMEVLFR